VKALKHNDQHWEDTCIILIEACFRTLKKFASIGTDNQPLATNFWNKLAELIVELIDVNGTLELVKIVFKSIQDLSDQVFETIVSASSIVTLLKTTSEFFRKELDRDKDDKNKVLKLLKSCPVLVDSLNKICS